MSTSTPPRFPPAPSGDSSSRPDCRNQLFANGCSALAFSSEDIFTAESMSAIILHRTDPARNMRRFYRLDVPAPIYSGNGALSSEWGRIGCAGQVRTIPYPTAAGAHEALACLALSLAACQAWLLRCLPHGGRARSSVDGSARRAASAQTPGAARRRQTAHCRRTGLRAALTDRRGIALRDLQPTSRTRVE